VITFLRSLLFNVVFYALTAVILIVTLPVFPILPQGFAMGVVRTWAKVSTLLLQVLAGTRLEVRGLENLPAGGVIVAAKHQSAFETFALIPFLRNPTVVMKEQLRWIPIFGHYTVKAGMIHVHRRGGSAALRALVERAGEELAKGREIVIFPEGARRPPGAAPDYHTGVALLYRSLGIPVVPVALNSGLYWPRRHFLHYPGTIIVEFLPPIRPGLESRAFLDQLETAIETASDRLLAEADRAHPRPPFPQEAAARLAERG
jgi:1-acyl-sn-glycerol-3-phosphate acyltransferase